jgi:hypothetical protein
MTKGQSQKLKLPDKPYVLVIGKYKFTTETVIEKNPDLSQGFSSQIFGGLQLQKQQDSIKSKPVYLNGDSLRTETYLYQNETFRISYPRKIDTIRVRDIMSNKSYLRSDTTDHFDINKLVDTISAADLERLFSTEIEMYNGNKKLKVRRIGLRLIWPNGKQFYTNYERTHIGDYPKILEVARSLSPNGYVILDSVWFYNLEKEQDQMIGSIGWIVR